MSALSASVSLALTLTHAHPFSPRLFSQPRPPPQRASSRRKSRASVTATMTLRPLTTTTTETRTPRTARLTRRPNRRRLRPRLRPRRAPPMLRLRSAARRSLARRARFQRARVRVCAARPKRLLGHLQRPFLRRPLCPSKWGGSRILLALSARPRRAADGDDKGISAKVPLPRLCGRLLAPNPR
jgi:hypothetical protein